MTAARIALLALSALSGAAHCANVDFSVAGIPLGVPMEVKPCELIPGLALPNQHPMPPIVGVVTAPCLSDAVELGSGRFRLKINLPWKQKPSIMAWDGLVAYVRPGAIVGVDFYTHGVTTQEYDLDTLTKKYGPPTSRSTVPVQNKLGAKFDSIHATWALDGLSVSFFGTWGTLDQGMVMVDLPEAAELRAAVLAKSANPNKL